MVVARLSILLISTLLHPVDPKMQNLEITHLILIPLPPFFKVRAPASHPQLFTPGRISSARGEVEQEEEGAAAAEAEVVVGQEPAAAERRDTRHRPPHINHTHRLTDWATTQERLNTEVRSSLFLANSFS